MRNSLINAHDVIRKQHIATDPHCKICGCTVDLTNSHLDHCGKYEFKEIATRFINDSGGFMVINGVGNFGTDAFMDDADEQNWLDLHETLAELQLTCVTCNLTKKKK